MVVNGPNWANENPDEPKPSRTAGIPISAHGHDINPSTNQCRNCGMSYAHIMLRPVTQCVPSEVLAVDVSLDALDARHKMYPPLNLDQFQSAVGAWCLRNFGIQSDLVLYGGTAEECGEMLRGAVKREQGIRGTREEWDAEIRKEMGDVAVKLASIAAQEGWNLSDIIAERWSDVSQRDWSGPDKVGHGLPQEES